MPPVRVDYDTVAHLYDTQPYRTKSIDPELLALGSERMTADTLSILDIGCGTGNQLVANRTAVPSALMIGLDRSLGMLRQAQRKASDIAWVRADAAMLPFEAESFDLVTCQHAFHHVQDKAGMVGSAFRVLRPGGRFVVHSLCPQESTDWLYYEYFPDAYAIDVVDFWAPEAIMTVMETTGFRPVTVERRQIHYEQNMRDWLNVLRRRDTCSQLMAISDAAYAAGLRRLEQELDNGRGAEVRAEHLCLANFRGEKPIGVPEQSGRG
jgi:ubiquinone/menaquinone biosynthesis C-methylase UbiE